MKLASELTSQNGINRIERSILAAIGLLIFLQAVRFPWLASADLDPSWQAILHYAFLEGKQFGKDIIFTYGPWGWLGVGASAPGSQLPKIAWSLVSSAIFASVIIHTSIGFSSLWRRYAFPVASLLLTPLFPETLQVLCLVLVLLEYVCFRRRAALLYPSLALIAFMAQMKFTYAMVGFMALFLCMSRNIAEGSMKSTARQVIFFTLTYLLFWVLAGQSLEHIPAYFTGCFQISGGYPNAMSLTSRPFHLAMGALVCLLHGGYGAWILLQRKFSLTNLTALLILGLAGYVTWKHSFTRADGHILALFSLSPAIALYTSERLERTAKLPLGAWYSMAVIIASLVTVYHFNAKLVTERVPSSWVTIKNNAKQLKSFNLANTSLLPHQNDLSQRLQEEIGNASVDIYSYEQAFALNNSLNYQNRPVPQSYSAYTADLLKRNAEHVIGDSSPDYILFKLQSIDGRVPSIDDSLAIVEISKTYQFIKFIDDFALFKQQPLAADFIPFSPNASTKGLQTIELNQEIEILGGVNEFKWLQLETDPSLFEKLKSFLYQPSELWVSVTLKNGEIHRHRVIPSIAQIGFTLSPWLSDTTDFISFSRGEMSKNASPVSIKFETKNSRFNPWKELRLRIHSNGVSPLNLSPDNLPPSITELSNLKPVAYAGNYPIERHLSEDGTPFFQFHPESKLTFTVDPPYKELSFQFGIREGANRGDHPTDGVTFQIIWNDSVIFDQTLTPSSKHSDSSLKKHTIQLPESSTNNTVHFITTNQPGSNGHSDWAFWRNIKFEQ